MVAAHELCSLSHNSGLDFIATWGIVFHKHMYFLACQDECLGS